MTKDKKATPKPEKKNRLSRFNRLFLFLNLIFVVLLLSSYMNQFISPSSFWPLAFFGLAYPFILLVNFLFVFLWMFQWKREFLISLITIIIGWNNVGSYIQLNLSETTSDKSTVKTPQKAVKVMSYNVRQFDLYNWTNNKKTRNKLLDFLQEEGNEILCMQEIYTDSKRDFITIDTLVRTLHLPYTHVEYTKIINEEHRFGICTMSKFPITNKGTISFGEKNNNICIYTDFKIADDTIRVYNMHLQSIHFRQEDYKFIEALNTDKKVEQLEGTRKILRRLKKGFITRSTQVELVAAHIQSSPHPVIVCGDFNDPPVSYTYQKISQNLKDAFKISGNGLGRTYNGKFPSFRIDYILHSESLKSTNFQTLPDDFSDHFPISCEMQLK